MLLFCSHWLSYLSTSFGKEIATMSLADSIAESAAVALLFVAGYCWLLIG